MGIFTARRMGGWQAAAMQPCQRRLWQVAGQPIKLCDAGTVCGGKDVPGKAGFRYGRNLRDGLSLHVPALLRRLLVHALSYG